jgi:hypothetical protein
MIGIGIGVSEIANGPHFFMAKMSHNDSGMMIKNCGEVFLKECYDRIQCQYGTVWQSVNMKYMWSLVLSC